MIRLKGLKEDEIKDNAHGIKKVLFGFQVSGGKMVTIMKNPWKKYTK